MAGFPQGPRQGEPDGIRVRAGFTLLHRIERPREGLDGIGRHVEIERIQAQLVPRLGDVRRVGVEVLLEEHQRPSVVVERAPRVALPTEEVAQLGNRGCQRRMIPAQRGLARRHCPLVLGVGFVEPSRADQGFRQRRARPQLVEMCALRVVDRHGTVKLGNGLLPPGGIASDEEGPDPPTRGHRRVLGAVRLAGDRQGALDVAQRIFVASELRLHEGDVAQGWLETDGF